MREILVKKQDVVTFLEITKQDKTTFTKELSDLFDECYYVGIY